MFRITWVPQSGVHHAVCLWFIVVASWGGTGLFLRGRNKVISPSLQYFDPLYLIYPPSQWRFPSRLWSVYRERWWWGTHGTDLIHFNVSRLYRTEYHAAERFNLTRISCRHHTTQFEGRSYFRWQSVSLCFWECNFYFEYSRSVSTRSF